MDSKKPVFISGLYRSGTTILTRILDQNENIKSTYDTIHYMRFSYNKYAPIENNYKQLIKDTSSRIKDRWNMNLDTTAIFNLLEERNISEASVYNAIMTVFLKIKNNQRWCEKTNVNWESIPHFLKMFPNAKVIHIYRDPRAVLASYREMTIHKENFMYMDAIFASLAMFNFISLIEIKKNPNILLLKYEDFVSYPEQYTKKVCSFLDISYNSKMLDVKSYKDKFGKKFDTDSSFTAQKNNIDTSSLDLWKKELSKLEIFLCEKILREKLIQFNYSLKNPTLNNEEQNSLNRILNTPFINKRYSYYLKHLNGLEAYPNSPGAYDFNE